MSEANKDQVVDLSKPARREHVRVTFLPEGRTVEFEFGSPALRRGTASRCRFWMWRRTTRIFLDHACGGVCACTTCHLHVKDGAKGISEPDDKELDRMETAADVQLNSRLGLPGDHREARDVCCRDSQWNRNYVQEGKPAMVKQTKCRQRCRWCARSGFHHRLRSHEMTSTALWTIKRIT